MANGCMQMPFLSWCGISQSLEGIYLQVTKRTGWLHMKINGPESIADHMYRMGLMAMIVDAPGIDVNK